MVDELWTLGYFNTVSMFISVTSLLRIVDVVSLVSFILTAMPYLLDN